MNDIFIKTLGIMVPFSLLRKIFKNKVVIPYYHMVSDEDVIHVKHLYRYKNVSSFIADMEFLLKYYKPIDVYELIDIVRNGKEPGKPCFIPTFDDGFSEMHDLVAPILQRKGIPAIFFVNSGFIDNKDMAVQNKASVLIENIIKKKPGYSDLIKGLKALTHRNGREVDEMANRLDFDMRGYLEKRKPYLTEKQMKKMRSDGFFFGAHSIDHPLYRDLGLVEQIRQTKESINFILEKITSDFKLFAFPHTDNRVSKEYFNKIQKDNIMDLTFGTSGLKEDSAANNIQRISFEKSMENAATILRTQYMKKIFRILINNDIIVRE